MADVSSKYNLQRSQGHRLLLGSKAEEKSSFNSSQNFPKLGLDQFFLV